MVALTLRLLDAPHLLAIERRLCAADVGIDSTMAAALRGDLKAPPAVSASKGTNLPLSETSCAPSPVQIGVAQKSTCLDIDTFDINIDMEAQDENAVPSGERGMPMPSCRQATRSEGSRPQPSREADSQTLASSCDEVAGIQEEAAAFSRRDASLHGEGGNRSMPLIDEDDMSIPIFDEGGMSNPNRGEGQ